MARKSFFMIYDDENYFKIPVSAIVSNIGASWPGNSC